MLRSFIPQDEIEEEVEYLLERGHSAGMARVGAVDIDWLCEGVLGWTLVYDDTLPQGIEGMSNSRLHLVRLNAAIQNSDRVRFTLAHELGHIVLHHPQLERVSSQVRLFEEALDSAILLREAHIETQADLFAAALLLPLSRLKDFGFQPFHDRIGQVHLHFQASRQSTRIRLEQLGLLSTQAPLALHRGTSGNE